MIQAVYVHIPYSNARARPVDDKPFSVFDDMTIFATAAERSDHALCLSLPVLGPLLLLGVRLPLLLLEPHCPTRPRPRGRRRPLFRRGLVVGLWQRVEALCRRREKDLPRGQS